MKTTDTMTSFKLFIPLFLALISGCASRPTEMPETCITVIATSCPPDYSCYKNATSENPVVGSCRCNRYFGLQDIEGGGCEKMAGAYEIGVALNFVIFFMNGFLAFKAFQTLTRLIKAGALKKNTAGVMLGSLSVACTLSMMFIFCFIYAMLGFDKDLVLFDGFRNLLLPPLVFLDFLVCYECLLTWIDLVQKSVTMSKTSSRSLTVFKYFLRSILLTHVVVVTWMYVTGQLYYSIYLTVAQFFFVTALLFFSGIKIAHALCPDFRNKSHPNYRSARAILITAAYSCTALILALISNFIFLARYKTVYSTGNISMILGTVGWQFVYCLQLYQWLSYIKYGNRKALAKFPENEGIVTRLFEKMCFPVDREPAGSANRKSSQVEPELASVQEEQP